MLSDCAMRYLLAIYELSRGQHALRSVQIARELNVSRASVAKMLKALGQEELVAKEYYSNVCLTPKGVQVAGALYAEYVQLLRFYTHEVGLDEARAKQDAVCSLCALSEKSKRWMMQFGRLAAVAP